MHVVAGWGAYGCRLGGVWLQVAHHSFLPDGTLLGSYGRGVYAGTAAALGNGCGERQRRNAHTPRQALRARLLRGLAAGTVQWGHRLRSYEEDAGGVTLHFVGGGEARAAVVVGCDGIWSAMRQPLLACNP